MIHSFQIKNFKLKIGLVGLIGLISLICLISQIKQPATPDSHVLSKQVTVSAQVGGYTLNRLSGYTSPFAEVLLNSVYLARKTLADATGYFLFTNIPILPNLGELCLVSQDVTLLPSFPTCLAPPPSDQNIDIIGILLSPSITIGSPVVQANSTVVASGMTFPSVSVSVYLYSQNETIFYYFSQWLAKRSYRWPWSVTRAKDGTMTKLVTASDRANFILKVVLRDFSPVKTAHAFSLPKYETKSNKDGYFEFSLPNGESSNRFYVAAALNVGENLNAQATENEISTTDLRDSPKSNTLYFRSMGFVESLTSRLLTALKLFFTNLDNPFGLIVVEITVVLILVVLLITKINSNKEYN